MKGLKRLTTFRNADAALPVAVILLLAALFAAGADATVALRYERVAVLHGEAWRLLTGHLVHADAAHLAWNVVGVVLVAFLFAREFPAARSLAVLLASTAAIDAGFVLLEPQLEWYVGFSGVLHGWMAAGLVAWLHRARDPLTWLVAALFVAKLAWEHCVGPLPFTAESLSLPVVHEAHSYGAIGGALCGWLFVRRPVAPASL